MSASWLHLNCTAKVFVNTISRGSETSPFLGLTRQTPQRWSPNKAFSGPAFSFDPAFPAPPLSRGSSKEALKRNGRLVDSMIVSDGMDLSRKTRPALCLERLR